MYNKHDLLNSLKDNIMKTIPLLEKALSNSNDQDIVDFLKKYENSLHKLNTIDHKILSARDFKTIRHCTRIYIESNSRWDQPFLHQMGEVEKILKALHAI